MATIDLTNDNLNLVDNADTRHETAEDWYGSFGWHLPTRRCGDVCLQAVDYDWLDNTDDDDVVELLRDGQEQLTRGEALEIVRRAREVREYAEGIESLLDEAVSAYESGVVSDCLSALRECRAMEIEGGGDSPATDGLAGQLLEEWEDVAEEDEDEE